MSGHNIGARADRRVAGVHDQAYHAVGRRAHEGGGHEQVDEAGAREIGIDGDAMRPALALAEEIGRGDRRPVAPEQGVPRAIRPAHRQPAAFFRDEQRAIRREGQVPRAIEAVEHDGPRQRGLVTGASGWGCRASAGVGTAGDGAAHTEDAYHSERDERVTDHDRSSCVAVGVALCGRHASQEGQGNSVLRHSMPDGLRKHHPLR